MTWIDLTGYLASLAVLATFCMSRMICLRAVAVLSNVLFVTYGIGEHLYPVLILHVALLPINIMKIFRLRRQVGQVFSGYPGERAASAIKIADRRDQVGFGSQADVMDMVATRPL